MLQTPLRERREVTVVTAASEACCVYEAARPRVYVSSSEAYVEDCGYCASCGFALGGPSQCTSRSPAVVACDLLPAAMAVFASYDLQDTPSDNGTRCTHSCQGRACGSGRV